MAIDTVAGDIDVIKVGREPGNGRVTIVTISATRDMCWVFSGSRRAVMARPAGAENLRVIDSKCWFEG